VIINKQLLVLWVVLWLDIQRSYELGNQPVHNCLSLLNFLMLRNNIEANKSIDIAISTTVNRSNILTFVLTSFGAVRSNPLNSLHGK